MQKKEEEEEEEQDFSLVRDFFSLSLKGRRIEEGTDFPGERGAAAAPRTDGEEKEGKEKSEKFFHSAHLLEQKKDKESPNVARLKCF